MNSKNRGGEIPHSGFESSAKRWFKSIPPAKKEAWFAKIQNSLYNKPNMSGKKKQTNTKYIGGQKTEQMADRTAKTNRTLRSLKTLKCHIDCSLKKGK